MEGCTTLSPDIRKYGARIVAELRYGIYNKCPECNEFEHGMDFDRLLEAPDIYSRNVFCKRTNRCRHVKVKNKLVFPPQGKYLDKWR